MRTPPSLTASHKTCRPSLPDQVRVKSVIYVALHSLPHCQLKTAQTSSRRPIPHEVDSTQLPLRVQASAQ
ncbi:hypothetical protein ACCO45_001415 [Purpureocillium lilacinum]|uniref:Uncharacterized protein n=1 Tax=Purpureocillium lilacinum TaxID=33203 RepID=A0ACC4E6Y2_PURLI